MCAAAALRRFCCRAGGNTRGGDEFVAARRLGERVFRAGSDELAETEVLADTARTAAAAAEPRGAAADAGRAAGGAGGVAAATLEVALARAALHATAKGDAPGFSALLSSRSPSG